MPKGVKTGGSSTNDDTSSSPGDPTSGLVSPENPDSGLFGRGQGHHGEEPGRQKGPTVEYEYILELKALEDLAELMKRHEVPVPTDFAFVSFKSPKRLDLREYQKRGVISSYVVIKAENKQELVEEFVRERTLDEETEDQSPERETRPGPRPPRC